MTDQSPTTVQIESLFDQAARGAASPALRRRRRSRLRNLFTSLLLLIFIAVIAGYGYVTDAERVRDLSQRFLTQLSGGNVTVDKAALSIFEGLRLDGIRITIGPDKEPFFDARTLHISYNPLALLRGRVEADRVLAIEPHWYVVEDVDRKLWNFQLLAQRQEPGPQQPDAQPQSATPDEAPMLPEVIVRNARIDYGQIVHGARSHVGTLALEGQLTPDPQRFYHFRLQSRGGAGVTAGGIFPVAEGWVDTSGGSLGVVLRDVEFVDEIKTIMPAVVRRFWEQHNLAGRMGETRVSYFRKPDGKAGFKVETDLDGVRLSVPPAMWAGPQDLRRVARWRDTFGLIGQPVFGASPFAQILLPTMDPNTLQLDEVDGTFVFTDEQITISNLVARIENNRFKVTGRLDGYTADAGASIKIESLRTQDVYIPEAPTFIAATPWPVQEIYYRFRPRGTAGFWVQLDRPSGHAKQPTLKGEIEVHDASFVFERFPYPVDHANGTIRFGNDPTTGREMLEIVSIKGRGYTGGPNEHATLELSGRISPLDDTARADIKVTGQNIVSEPRLIDAMPPMTRKSILNFDGGGTGKLPQFGGNFECTVHRAHGRRQPWLVTTLLDIRKANGALRDFPYPMRDVDAQIDVHEDYLEIKRAVMKRDDMTIELSGIIDWTTVDRVTRRPIVQPALTLKATGVPIDSDLMNALPEQKRAWLRRISLKGLLDINGRITAAGKGSDEVVVDLNTTLRKGAARLPGGGATITDLSAVARIGATHATITSLSARRGKARIEGEANIDLSAAEPTATAAVRVTSLDVKDVLGLLPAESRASMDALHAVGTVDVNVDIAGGRYRAALKPNTLSLRPDLLPLPMTDAAGEIRIDGNTVTLKNLSAKLAQGTLFANGTIDTADSAATLALAGRDIQVTPEIRAAMPPALAKFLAAIELSGKIAFDCPKLEVRQAINLSGTTTQPVRTTHFENVALWLQKTSMSLGAPVTDATGVIRGSGIVSEEKLRSLTGTIELDELHFAGRPLSKVTATVIKPADRELLQIAKIEGRLADGQVAGQLDTMIAPNDSRFGLSLVVRNAHVPDLTGEMEKPIEGRLTASLAMEGDWANAKTRRGRGDVIVEGREMYRVPLLFGVMQIANLTLPIDSPIRQAGVKYTIEGPRLTLEQIDLRSRTAAMQGSGSIDFDTKQVQMTLGVSNEAADAVPIFGDLVRGVSKDLLQVKVRGTLQEPKVQAQAFNMFSTTVDEIVKGK